MGRPGVLAWDASRSGAKIRDLPGVRGLPGEREVFADVYPHVFETAAQRAAFLAGTADRADAPASRLYGEIPSTFPTVLGQVKMIPARLARRIEIALVDGGINDISPEEVINPLVATGRYVERYDGDIRRIVNDNVSPLLAAVRAKCPRAVIMYVGFFPGLSYTSNERDLRELFKHEYDDDFKWWFNRYIYQVVDINAMINEAKTRALWFNGRWQYWTRQAVNRMAANDSTRGPGVVFVPSGFSTSNAGFARYSRLWDDYIYPVQDPARFERTSRIPRQAQLQLMRETHAAILVPQSGPWQRVDPRSLAQQLDAAIDGPGTLKRDLQDYVAGQSGGRDAVLESLGDEIHRIQHGLIASLAHPNEGGSVSYATQAARRYTEHLATMDEVQGEVRAQVQAGPVATTPATPAAPTLDATLRRYNLRGRGSLAGAVTNLDVDSIAVIIKTAPNSSRNMGLPAYLDLSVFRPASATVGHRQELLTFENYVEVRTNPTQPAPRNRVIFGDPINKPYPYLEPGQTNRFTLVIDDLKLLEITGAAIVLGEDPWPDMPRSIRSRYGRTWTPDWVALEINGQRVRTAQLFGQSLGPNGHVDLGWPDPNPTLQPPRPPRMRRVRRVRQLGRLATTPNLPGPPAPH